VRKLISILVVLGLVLGFSAIAAPVAAVSAPITVEVDNPITGENSTYTIVFHNDGTLIAGFDWIDVMFPAGTNATSATVVSVNKAATAAKLVTAPVAVGFGVVQQGDTYIRIATDDIYKCEWVEIVIDDVTNPAPCFHHLQVGTSSHTPVASEDYTIYSLKMCLSTGKNLISLPAYPEDPAIAVVLADLFAKVELTKNSATPFTFSVWYWDAAALKWLKYASDSSFKDLTKIEVGKAYWIKVNAPACFRFKGVGFPDDQGPPPKFCWYVRSFNMVGVTSTSNITASEYLKYTLLPPFFTQYAVVAIYEWSGTAYVDLGWNGQYLTPSGDPILQPGHGYWMAFIDAACIIPPVPAP
jgi:hypothetical protein